MPLNTTNIYNCPYASTCCYSFDEMYVDPDDLLQKGYITQDDLRVLKSVIDTKKVAYAIVKQEKQKLLNKAFDKLDSITKNKIEQELKTSSWLYDYAYFKTMLDEFNTDNFRDVPKELTVKNSSKYIEFAEKNHEKIVKYGFFQYLLAQQWQKVRAYAKTKGVKILGDLPIYPDPNSFDVYAYLNQFKLDEQTLKPLVYGGVPKDEFCEDGQNWGTCVYDWDGMKKDGYSFMIDKVKQLLTKYDILRLDHFLGYVEHYEWNANRQGEGEWQKSGGEDFFKCLAKQIDMNSVVIEDLGIETPKTTKIRNEFSLKGMCVLQMVMESDKNYRYLPSRLTDDCLYYLGTHDNNTFIGYLNSLSEDKKSQFCELMQIQKGTNEQIHIDCIKQMLNSRSSTVILQIQDLLMQDEESRMNVPGQAADCWEYKMPQKYEECVKNTLEKINWK